MPIEEEASKTIAVAASTGSLMGLMEDEEAAGLETYRSLWNTVTASLSRVKCHILNAPDSTSWCGLPMTRRDREKSLIGAFMLAAAPWCC